MLFSNRFRAAPQRMNRQDLSVYEKEQPLTKKSKGRTGPGIIVLRLVSHYRIHLTQCIKNFLGLPAVYKDYYGSA